MFEEDVQFTNLLKGKRIKLTLRNSSYSGTVQRINPNKTVVLADVHDGNGCKIPGTKLFFGREIINVSFEFEANRERGDSHQWRLEEQLTVEKFQPYRQRIALDDDEDEGEYIDFVVVDEFIQKFGSAVMHLKKQRVVSVGCEGIEMYKNGRLCWLQIAVKNKVYLFDILRLGTQAFKNGLAMILESKQVLKVMHDCRAISGCLATQFGVRLTNVFDTQVADVLCFRSETGGFLPDRVSTLEQVVNLHLKVPSSQLSSIQMKCQLTKEEEEVWYMRPCPVPLLKVMALSVIHLLPLRLVLLDALMTDYMEAVDSYLSSSHYQPDELEHVSMENLLELPGELRQLDQMYRERREWAAGRYPLTQRGLLVRFSEQPQASTQAATENQSNMQPESAVSETALPKRDPVCQAAMSPTKAAFVTPQTPASAAGSVPDQRAEMCAGSSPSDGPHPDFGVGLGRSLKKEESSSPTLPSLGRGFLLRMPSAQIPGEGADGMRAPGGTETAPSAPETTPRSARASFLPRALRGGTGEGFAPSPPSLSSSSFGACRF